jgi:hypothetical protein
MIINDLFNNKKPTVAESMTGKVVFSGTGANGGKYEIIQSGPTDFMIHANGKHIDTYGSLQRAMSVLKNEVPGLQQGVAEGWKDKAAAAALVGTALASNAVYQDGVKVSVDDANKLRQTTLSQYEKDKKDLKKHKADLDKTNAYIKKESVAEGLPQTLRKVVPGYAKREIDRKMDAEKFGRTDVDRDANYYRYKKIQDKIKEQDMAEASLGDYRKKAAVSQAGAKINRFFGRDDAAKVAAADQTIAKRTKGLARADARINPYTPPSFDAEKYQRDLTAKYPNIDQLVADAERNRDPYYDRAEGSDYYAGREAEQLYQRLKQIQRVIQGLNESQDEVKKKYKQVPSSSGIINAATGRGYTPDELGAEYPDFDFDREEKQDERKRLKDLAKQERLKDKIKASLDDPRDTAKDLAKSFLNKGGLGLDFKPPSPRPTVTPAPAPVTVQAQPPGFTASNLAQQPGMAQYMQQKPVAPKPAPNFAQGPAGYKTATTNVPPVATTTTAPPVEKNTSDILQALTKMGFKTKEAEAAINRLPPNISTKDAILQILRGKQMSESLTWSPNFDPGRSLYRQIKQDR